MADTQLQLIINAQNNTKAAIAQVKSAMDDLSDQTNKVNQELKAQKADLSALQGMYSKMAIVSGAIGTATGALTLSLVKQASAMEQTKVSFSTMLGSLKEGEKLFNDLAQLAKETPFEFPELQESTKRLLAYGIAQEDIILTMGTLGDIASGVGREKLPQLITAFGQIKAAGVLTGMELRQLTETGVPIIEELVKTTGYSAKQITSNTKDLGISFETVRKSLENMTKEGGKFNNMMMNQSKTLGGMWSNFKDSIGIMSAQIGTALLPSLKILLGYVLEVANAFTMFITAHPHIAKLIGVTLTLTTAVAGLALGYALLQKAFVGMTLPTISAVTGALKLQHKAVLEFATKGLPALARSFLPVTLALGALYLAWKVNFLHIREILASAIGFVSSAFKAISGFIQIAGLVFGKFAKIVDSALGDVNKSAEENTEYIQSLFENFNRNMDGLVNTFVLLLSDDIGGAWAGMGQDARDGVVEMLQAMQWLSQAIIVPSNMIINKINEVKGEIASKKYDKWLDVQKQKYGKDFEPSLKEIQLYAPKVNLVENLNDNWADEFKKSLDSIPLPVKKVQSGFGGGGGEEGVAGAVKKAKDEFAKFAEDVDSDSKKISSKIFDIQKSIVEVNKETQDAHKSAKENFIKDMSDLAKEVAQRVDDVKASMQELEKSTASEYKSNRSNLADAYIGAETRLIELKKERADIEAELARASSQNEMQQLQERLGVANETILKETQALENASRYQGEISSELAKARELAGMTELERAIYEYEQQKTIIQAAHDDKMSKLQAEMQAIRDYKDEHNKAINEAYANEKAKINEKHQEQIAKLYEELAEVQVQQTELVAKVKAKNEELALLYGQDTQTFVAELNAQVQAVQNTSQQMISAYNAVARARANAVGGNATTINMPRREFGGAVSAGQSYIVGERRAEIFTPQRSGYISPSTGGSGVVVNISVSGSIIEERNLVEKIQDSFVKSLQKSNSIR